MARCELSEMPDVASFEIIAPNTPELDNDPVLVYQELQPTLPYQNWKDFDGLQNEQSPDHGYESDRSAVVDSELVACSYVFENSAEAGYTSCGPPDGLDIFSLKLEEIDVILQQPQCTDALVSGDADLSNLPIMTPTTFPDGRIDEIWRYRPTSESDSQTSCCSSTDSGVYALGSNVAIIEELEISESEDVECHVSRSPLPGDATTNEKKKRRRRKRSSKQPILWRFLLDALNDPDTFGSMIHWVNKAEGSFQFTTLHKEQLSQKWGEAKKNRCTMTYQKMARALRNYINRREVLRKVKKKLQYTFIPEFYREIRHMVK